MGSTSTSVSTPTGAYSVSITRGPLVPSSPQHGASTVNIPSPRTPSVQSPSSSISRPTSRPPSALSRPPSTASRPPSVMQGSPAGVTIPGMASPLQVPVAAASTQSQTGKSSDADAPLDLSKPLKPSPAPQTPRSDGNATADDPLDLSSQSSGRKRKNDDSDDDIICVGMTMPPKSSAPPKVPRLAPSMLTHTGAYVPSQVYQVHHAHHAHAMTPHRLPSQYSASHARTTAAAGGGGAGGLTGRFGMTQQQQQQTLPTKGQRTSYSNHPMRPSVRAPPSQGKSILEEYIEAYKSGQNFPPRPATPGNAQRPTPSPRSSGPQPPPNVPHPGSGVLKTPSQFSILQQRQQLLQEAKNTMEIQMRRRQLLASRQGLRTAGPAAPAAAQGSIQTGTPKSTGVNNLVQTGQVPGLPDVNSSRQSNMLKQHPELHNVQIQGGRMVVQRPGVVVDNRNNQPGQNAAASPTQAGGGQQPKVAGKERITYMMASEPVPACATTNATAIQITQQPTFIGAPLMVPNPALSRLNSGVQTTTTTSTTATNIVGREMSAPCVVKTEKDDSQTYTQTGSCSESSAQPQKHFTNTDTQTADLPGDQWHRPPFHRIGMQNKNIPVANVNPMPHKCASPALHPKKQILFQTQTANEGQERPPSESKSEVSSRGEAGATLTNQDSISLKPEYSSSADVKVDMSGHHDQYRSKMKETLMRRMYGDGSNKDVKVKQENKSCHGSGGNNSLKILKRKSIKSGPGKYTAPLMKKAAQAMKREHVPYHHSSSQQQHQGSPHAQVHGKPVLSKTVLDLSDITGESVDEAERRSPHKRPGHAQLKGSPLGGRKAGIQKLKEVRLPRPQKSLARVKEEKKVTDKDYDGETEVENSESEVRFLPVLSCQLK